MSVELLLAVAAGLAFSMIGIAYRSNSAMGLPPAFAAVAMGLAGTAWFGVRSFIGDDAPGPHAPWMVWAWGGANGLAQGLAVWLIKLGLRRGPLGPVWCAANLTFVTPALYAVLLLGERLSATQAAGMAAAFLCVAVSSVGHGNGAAAGRPTPGQRLQYGALLLALVLATGLLGVGLKHLAATAHAGAPLNPRFNDCFMLGMYGLLAVFAGAESWRHGRPAQRGRLARNGLLAAAGSVCGMALTARVSDLPGGIGFAVLSVSGVVAGSLIASFGFGEKRGPAWYATVGLAVAAVILFNRP